MIGFTSNFSFFGLINVDSFTPILTFYMNCIRTNQNGKKGKKMPHLFPDCDSWIGFQSPIRIGFVHLDFLWLWPASFARRAGPLSFANRIRLIRSSLFPSGPRLCFPPLKKTVDFLPLVVAKEVEVAAVLGARHKEDRGQDTGTGHPVNVPRLFVHAEVHL